MRTLNKEEMNKLGHMVESQIIEEKANVIDIETLNNQREFDFLEITSGGSMAFKVIDKVQTTYTFNEGIFIDVVDEEFEVNINREERIDYDEKGESYLVERFDNAFAGR